MKTIGVPYGFLIVDDSKGDRDLYRRAIRVVRTFNMLYGNSNYGVLDWSQLDRLTSISRKKHKINTRDDVDKRKKGRGGEGSWAREIRNLLVSAGKAAGFGIKEDWTPPFLEDDYKRKQKVWLTLNTPNDDTAKRFFGRLVDWNPMKQRAISKWSQYYTKSALDVTWTITLPRAFKDFLDELIEISDEFMFSMPILRTTLEYLPIVGFEIERTMGKHGGGGILNLSRYTFMGVVIVPDSDLTRVEAKIDTYRSTQGFQNVFALKDTKVKDLYNREVIKFDNE